ncbi:aspartic protease in guard cell 1 [Spatholobus suberectus]|nr:aspartic protease in guard cell 1 [Spatholobus suberectus]
MAVILNKPSFIFLTLSLFLIISLSSCLPHSGFSTSVLYVTEALHQVLSLSPSNAHHNNDYRSLVLAQLVRDSARVTQFLSNLSHVNNSAPYPPKTEVRPKGLSVPVTSGMCNGSGEYFLRIGVGQPPQPLYMVLDTGSDVTWLQCNPCSSCYKQSDPLFNPSTSSSYAPITCEAEQCRQLELSSCNNHQCNYEVVYGDLSYSNGTLVTETMSFGNTGSVNCVAIGCGHENRGLFVGAAGILGLGGGPLSFTSQTKAASFSYCLVNRDTDKSSRRDPVTRSRPNPSSGYGGIVVDSGTVITRLETRAYEAVRDAFVGMTRHLPRAKGFLILDTCYDLSSVKTATLPTMSLEMSDGRSWMLPQEGYMIPVDENGTFCFAFAPSPPLLSILGNVQQQGTRVSFDLVNSIIGFSPLKC